MPPPGADGDTPQAVAARLFERAARMEDPRPFHEVYAAHLEQVISDAFRDERSPAGEPWADLAPSTVAQRLAKLPGAKRRSKKTGQLTAAARAARGRGLISPGSIKKLIDAGRLRGSITVSAARDRIAIAGAAYLAAHVTGTDDMPARNPLPIESDGADGFKLIAVEHERYVGGLTGYINTGEIKVAA